jgi:ABC-type polysaccharide/polyol phosphate transport system ATPase subunit
MYDGAANDRARTIVAINGLGKRYGLSPRNGRGVLSRRAPARGIQRGADNDLGRMIWALREVSLRVAAGSATGIIGRNGAGKTTLLRILGRITAPTTGRIVGCGRIFPMLEVGASFHPDFTARENIFFNAAMFGVPRDEVRRRLPEILEFAGVGDRLDERVREMSTGAYIRLAFSLAVTLKPDLLLADEVLAVGDANFQKACLERIRAEKKRGMSVLFVSHDMAAVAEICDHVIWIDNGRVKSAGAPEEIIASYEHDLWRSKSRQVGDAANLERPVRLLAARAVGAAGRELGAIAQADALNIELVLESHGANIIVTPGVDIFAGSTLLASASAREPSAMADPGIYSASMEIPQWTFAAREIRFRPYLRVEPAKGAAYIAELNEMLSIRIHESERPDPDGKQHKRARAGYIAPQLDWKMRAGGLADPARRSAVGF